jgi:hypothetical protein
VNPFFYYGLPFALHEAVPIASPADRGDRHNIMDDPQTIPTSIPVHFEPKLSIDNLKYRSAIFPGGRE